MILFLLDVHAVFSYDLDKSSEDFTHGVLAIRENIVRFLFSGVKLEAKMKKCCFSKRIFDVKQSYFFPGKGFLKCGNGETEKTRHLQNIFEMWILEK